MKKIILLAAAAALVFAGCGQSEASSDNSAAQSSMISETGGNATAGASSVSGAADVSGGSDGSGTTGTPSASDKAQSSGGTGQSSISAGGSTDGDSPKKLINITAISQYPELPTGCEVTSLAVVLNYYGIDIDKCEIGDSYLDKGDVGTVDFHEAFEGDPRDESSFGCYAPVIVKAAEKILSERQSQLTVSEVSGSELEALFAYTDKDIPVIVWGTQNCQQGQYTVTWNVDGKDLTWFSPEHCMVLAGYSDSSVWVADPIYGEIKQYDINVFKSCYDSLYKQAIVIQ